MAYEFALRLSHHRERPLAHRMNSAKDAKLEAAQERTNPRSTAHISDAPPRTTGASATPNSTRAAIDHSGQRRASAPSRASSPRSTPQAPAQAPTRKYAR